MDFRTQIPLVKNRHQLIDHRSRLFLMGSCFSDSMGLKFEESGFMNQSNPFGILFQPLAIEQLITRVIYQDLFESKDLEYYNGRYSCLEVHSRFSHAEAQQVLKELNAAISAGHEALEAASHIFITLGTAWAYRFLSRDSLVANCHKIPQEQFSKELLSVETIQNSLEAIRALLNQFNPSATIVFTVSPVRHLKDGFVENNRSKSHLLTAVHEVVEAHKNSYYFPSYELLMDELRDYRFYQTDMLHPSAQAVDYIWDRFQQVWLTDEAIQLSKAVKNLRQGFAHSAFHPNSHEHQHFLKQLDLKKVTLLKKIPHLRF